MFHKVYEVLPILTIHRTLIFFPSKSQGLILSLLIFIFYFMSAQIIHVQVLLWETEREAQRGKP